MTGKPELWLALISATSLLLSTNCSRNEIAESGTSESKSRSLSFWIWNRQTPLSAKEIKSLEQASVARLYWQLGELSVLNGTIETISRFKIPDSTGGIQVVPVIRIASSVASPENLDASKLAVWAREAGVSSTVQFDYDCPNRLLPEYGQLLRGFRNAFGPIELSITALGDWCYADGWTAVEGEIDSAFPMLYDIFPERDQKQSTLDPRPLVEVPQLEKLLAEWNQKVNIPWEVGLPNFRRLTIFRDGTSNGHIRDWSREDLLGNPDLSLTGQTEPGVFLFQVARPTRVGEFAIEPDTRLCLRECDRTQLRKAIELTHGTSARGVCWFQMPRTGLASGGWSLREIANGFEGQPQLALEIRDQFLIAKNTGTSDLSPGWESGTKISLRWNGTALREYIPGDLDVPSFQRGEQDVPLFAATGMTFPISNIPAGESRSSGLILFRDPKISLALEYRIGEDSWTPLPFSTCPTTAP